MVAKKTTIKDLELELNLVKEEMKDINILKQRVEDLLKENEKVKKQLGEIPILKQQLVNLKNEITILLNESDKTLKTYKCRKCEKTFPSQDGMEKHFKDLHTRKIKCKLCDETFKSNHELEHHVEVHAIEKEFKCDVCAKEFYLEWRFKVHKSVHLQTTKVCKYFASNKICPFEPVGCKFKHDETRKQTDNSEEQTDNDKADTVDNHDYRFECAYCEFKTDDYFNFLDHIDTNHLESQEENEENDHSL